ncbi:MAG: hypothetical protein OEY88_05900 [Candidatus Bathyarchaeota archaeon]|nr:hypothetical protein [Candidatus Bathyarchaeota archaeon]
MKKHVRKWFICLCIVAALLISGTSLAVLASYVWPKVVIPFEVKEPIEILHYTSELRLFPGENKSFEATVQNHAAISYNVTLDFTLSAPSYQAAYVTFSDEVYTVAPGQQDLRAWVIVDSTAPAIICSLTIDFRRGDQRRTYEDFTTYTEVLGGGADRYTQTATKSSWAGLRRDDATAYVYKDYGAGYFTTFEHQMELHISAISSGNDPALYRLMVLPYICSTDTPTFSDDRLFYYIMKKPGDDTRYYVTFMAWHNNVDSMHASSRYPGIYFDVGTTYYVTVSKSGSTCRLVLRTGSHSGAIVWDSGDCAGWNDNYQYLYIPYHGEDAVDGTNTIDGYVENLNLQPGTLTPP